MEPIYIPHLLRSNNQETKINFEQFIEDLASLTAVKGTMVVTHKGTYLEVVAKAETIVTLSCDRCLSKYNHRLQINASEMIWLEKKATASDNLPLEREVSIEDLTESLEPNGHFSPEAWLYEQMCLALPMRQLCSNNCQPPQSPQSVEAPTIDKRWAGLQSLVERMN